MNNAFSFSRGSPHTCSHCCGSTYLRIIEEAAEANSPENAIDIMTVRLAILGEKRREYSIKMLSEKFADMLESTPSLAARGPHDGKEKSALRADFSTHPTHREWAAPSGAVAPDEGTPCPPEGSGSQGSQTRNNQH